MNFRFKIAAAAILAVSVVASYGQSDDMKMPMKKHHSIRKEKEHSATVEEQIQALRQELEGQIDKLQNNLAEKDAQLRQAQQAAADAQAAAAKAQAAVDAQQQADTENSAAVSTLQSTVKDLKGNQASLATTISDETSKLKQEVSSPDAINYKGITISPAGSFIAGETVWRSGATGDGLNTHFTAIPLQYADAANISEFQGSGRQSRLAIKATGKLDNMTLTGYYELDWLGAGITSNNNQSNSYVMRQRQIWAQAALKSGWTFTGGQMWSLATETTKGMDNGSEILPGTIDPQYTAGFVWTRQYGFRVSKAVTKNFWLGVSAENAETLNPAGTVALNSGVSILFGTSGDGGGLYNSTANYSFNPTPDFVAKAVWEPSFGGHYELFGIERNFRDRIYSSTASAYNDTEMGAGIGGGFRMPLANKKLSIGLKGLWGQGVGRYGDSTIADVTVRPDGTLAPLHGFSALSTLEANPTKRLSLYFNYGGDYINRDIITAADGYGLPSTVMSGCNTEVAASDSTAVNSSNYVSPATPANCKGNNKDVQEFSSGYWYNIYAGAKGRLRQGFQYSYIRRDLWSGVGGTTNPGGGAHGDDNIVETSFRYYLP